MNGMKTLFLTACATVAGFSGGLARADSESMNVLSLSYSKSHKVYAKSIPTESFGQKGATKVFRVGARKNTVLIAEYPWYAHHVFLGGKNDDTLIRFGPWPIGHTPRADQMALGIYRNGKLIRKYSTLQMYQLGSGMRISVSHHVVFSFENSPFRHIIGGSGHPNYYIFEITGVSGKGFQFNLDTGEVRITPLTPRKQVSK